MLQIFHAAEQIMFQIKDQHIQNRHLWRTASPLLEYPLNLRVQIVRPSLRNTDSLKQLYGFKSQSSYGLTQFNTHNVVAERMKLSF